jgi:hypothetical protein
MTDAIPGHVPVAPAFSDYIVFVDESGEHSLTSINAEYLNVSDPVQDLPLDFQVLRAFADGAPALKACG